MDAFQEIKDGGRDLFKRVEPDLLILLILDGFVFEHAVDSVGYKM